jgi:hypothetical protein
MTVLRNHGVLTYKDVLANRLDVITKNDLLIDRYSDASDRNIIQKEAEKKLKYKNLSTGISRM